MERQYEVSETHEPNCIKIRYLLVCEWYKMDQQKRIMSILRITNHEYLAFQLVCFCDLRIYVSHNFYATCFCNQISLSTLFSICFLINMITRKPPQVSPAVLKGHMWKNFLRAGEERDSGKNLASVNVCYSVIGLTVEQTNALQKLLNVRGQAPKTAFLKSWPLRQGNVFSCRSVAMVRFKIYHVKRIAESHKD